MLILETPPEGMSSIMTSNKNSGLNVGLNTIGGAL